MGNRKCLTHAKSRRAGWLGLIVAVVATSVALGGTAAMAKDAGPRAGTGTFAGIYVWGHGAGKCGRVESSTVLGYYCDDIQRNFAGSFVLIRFPSHEFRRSWSLRRVRTCGGGRLDRAGPRPRAVRLQARRDRRITDGHPARGTGALQSVGSRPGRVSIP
jgi:hypothetical protein